MGSWQKLSIAVYVYEADNNFGQLSRWLIKISHSFYIIDF